MLDQFNLPYLIEASLILALGYSVYRLFFAHDKDFIRNRIYLLTLTVFSFVLPLVSLPVFAREVILAPVRSVANSTGVERVEVVHTLDWVSLFPLIYFAVVVILSIRLLYHIVYISRVISTSERLVKNNVKYIITDQLTSPASIFDRLIVDKIDIPQQIVDHEKVHIAHGHTWDVLLMEIAKIILWFNPFVYFTARSVKDNHEYIADHLAAQVFENELDYSSILIQYAKSTKSPLLLNTFSTITKKRIIMLSKEKSTNQWKSLLIIPVLFSIVLLFSCDTYNVPVSPDGLVLTDNILESHVDTVTIFDYDTMKESVEIIKVYPNDIITRIDTVTVFDSETFEETVRIVKSSSPRSEILQQTYTTNEYNNRTGDMESKTYNRYPQDLVELIDTVVTFNYDTYEEKLQVVKSMAPREELISTKVTPKNQIKEGQKYDNVINEKNKVTVKKKGQ